MAASVLVHAALLASLPDPPPTRWALAVRRIDAQLVARPGTTQEPARATHVDRAADGPVSAVKSPSPDVRPSVADIGSSRRSARATPPAGVPADARAARSPVRMANSAPARTPDTASGEDAVTGAAVATALDAVSAEAMRQYRVDLALAARRFNAYPDVARARGWRGTVEVVVETSVRSPALRVRVLNSSGYAALDAQAVEMLTRAALATPLPAALKARDLRLVVAVRYDVDDEL